MKGIGASYRVKLSKVIGASKGGLTPELVERTLKVGRQEAGRLLSRWYKAGWLKKIKRGFYVAVPVEFSPDSLAIENPWLVVSKIFEPGYIGGFSAIKHWDLSEQIFETTVFLTTKKIKDRDPKYSNLKIHLKMIADFKFFGTKSVWIGSSKIQVSDPSKTIVDMLDEPALGGGMGSVREFFDAYLESEHKNLALLLKYASSMRNKTIFKRLGFLLEIMNQGDESIIENIRSSISSGYSNFDPSVENTRVIRRWNLKVPSSWAKSNDRKK